MFEREMRWEPRRLYLLNDISALIIKELFDYSGNEMVGKLFLSDNRLRRAQHQEW
jgi:hypothetical protein